VRRRATLRIAAGLALGLLAAAALPQVAGAVLAGTNGRIVFTSGRGGTDAEAKLRFWKTPTSALEPAISDPLSAAAGQHRHPSWSPDRTRIVYARGPVPYDLYILDLTAPPGTPPVNITNSPASEDRPAWSPDGTRIAYETDGGDILIRTSPFTGAPANFTPEADPASKPAWTPDSATVFYTSGAVNAAGAASIVRKAANNAAAAPTGVTFAPGVNEHQASVSPDGTRLCYTRGPFDGNADVIVSLLNGGGSFDLSDNVAPTQPADPGFGDYNCTWSPDGNRVAYVRGTFGAGDLVVERADDGDPSPLPLVDTPALFDGNPDWAPDGRPACQPRSLRTPRNTAVNVVLSCPDTGPAYEQSLVRVNVADPPANGTVPVDPIPAPTGSATVAYTPRAGFVGTDTFTYNAFDDAGFAPSVTVTITVTPPRAGGGPGGGLGVPGSARCDGKRATIVGTARGQVIRGTPRRDIIAALGGNDTVRGLGGADLICLGAGADRAFGGPGPDRILGQAGADRILGQAGADVLLGGVGRDVLLGGAGRNRALGGAGRDACSAQVARSC
jgi:Ca2+-binding RTX toxin-like protein